MPETMRAVLVRQPGGPEHLHLGEAEAPTPGPGEVVLEVHATALNRADLMQRAGRYDPPEGASPILGLEASGVVAAVGAGVDGWAKGDRACALLAGGGYAERVAVPADQLLPVPEGLDLVEAAAIPEVFLTAHQALVWLGRLETGERVLIHAGASGVGTAATQLASAIGATVYATASAPKHAVCRAMGAAATIDYASEAFDERVAALTDGGGVDVILDFVGAPYFKQNVNSLALDGRIVLLALLGGHVVPEWSLAPLFRKRGTVVASTLRNRAPDYKARLVRDFGERWLGGFSNGTLRPVIDRVAPWTEVAEAHRVMEANENAGKIVLQVREGDGRTIA